MTAKLCAVLMTLCLLTLSGYATHQVRAAGSAPEAQAKVDKGKIKGIVLGKNSSPLEGVTVELVNTSTGVRLESQTNAKGKYKFKELPTGRYEITLKMKGFQVSTMRDLAVGSDKATVVPAIQLVEDK
jgi:hypothetical protein